MMTVVENAREFAVNKHASQVRKYTGEPYTKHLAEVATLTANIYGEEHIAVAVAWLHDTLEDTFTTIDELSAIFGYGIAYMVDAMTDKALPAIGINRAERKRREAMRLASTCSEVQTVKCNDLISNTYSIAIFDKGFAKVYLTEAWALFGNLTGAHKTARLGLYNMIRFCEQLNSDLDT